MDVHNHQICTVKLDRKQGAQSVNSALLIGGLIHDCAYFFVTDCVHAYCGIAYFSHTQINCFFLKHIFLQFYHFISKKIFVYNFLFNINIIYLINNQCLWAG